MNNNEVLTTTFLWVLLATISCVQILILALCSEIPSSGLKNQDSGGNGDQTQSSPLQDKHPTCPSAPINSPMTGSLTEESV